MRRDRQREEWWCVCVCARSSQRWRKVLSSAGKCRKVSPTWKMTRLSAALSAVCGAVAAVDGVSTVIARSQHGHSTVTARSQHGHSTVTARSQHGHSTHLQPGVLPHRDNCLRRRAPASRPFTPPANGIGQSATVLSQSVSQHPTRRFTGRVTVNELR